MFSLLINGAGELNIAFQEKERGLATKAKNSLAAMVTALEKETRRLKARAERAKALMEIQNKVSEILGVALKWTSWVVGHHELLHMCGNCGDEGPLSRISDLQAHRGPDDRGVRHNELPGEGLGQWE